jgi:2-oxoacid:acceptor oxidoreductase delta subunit (pyruvate/2-ketoisovalerate family)
MKGIVLMTMKKRSELAKTYELKTWRDFPPMNISMGTMLHNMTGSWRFIKPMYEDKVPACQNACPAGNDIEGWIKLLQKGEYDKAYWHLKREQPFPAILGRICFRFCEAACNRKQLDSCVGINELERFVGDKVELSTPHPDLPEYNGQSLAVVGSGPAGMSTAYYGRLLGFRVTMFEVLPEMGGILRVGIPSYRLPREVVAEEFKGLKSMGIELMPNTSVGKDITLNELRNDYDYIFLATGVHESAKLNLKGEDESDLIMSGLGMLKKVALGEDVDLGKRVTVIGGGNTAIDAARTSVRLGSKVIVIYRRSETEMPAHPGEVEEAREEGVEFRFLAAPENIEINKDGDIERLVCCEMELGPPDESGRRSPVKKDGALFEVETDTILTAIGEIPAFDYLKGIVKTENRVVEVNEGMQVNTADDGKAKILAGGDIIDMPHTVVHAVASGKKAAIVMDCDRKGTDFSEVFQKIAIGDGQALSFSKYMGWAPLNPVFQNNEKVVDSEKIVYDYFMKAPGVEKQVLDAGVRKGSFDAYGKTFDEDQAQREAERCIHCGRCTECDNCLIFCPDVSILVRGEGQFGYAIDYDYCKGCGICFTECPRNAISMIDEEIPIQVDDLQ